MAKSINNFSKELANVQNAIMNGMEKAVIMFQADTMLLTHVDSGDLRRSWTYGVESNNGVVTGAVGSNLEYAPYEDDYHGNLSVAHKNNSKKYLDVVADAIKRS